MAKGQKRGNREIRKPKQDKAAPKVESALASQIIRLPSHNGARRGSH